MPIEKRRVLVNRLKRHYQAMSHSTTSGGLGGAWANAYAEEGADARREEGVKGLSRILDIKKELGIE